MSDNGARPYVTGPAAGWSCRLAGALLLLLTPFAASPLNMRISHALKPGWNDSVEFFAMAALLLSLAIGVFAVLLVLRRWWLRLLAIVVTVPAYGILWFGNQLDYGCRLYMSCL